MARHFVDVTKKAGYQPYTNDMRWQKELVAIRIPDMPNDGEAHVVSAGIRGVHYNIPRGVDVLVPKAVVEMLKTRVQHQWAMPAKNVLQGLVYLGKQPRFYIIELPKGAKGLEVRPAAPIAAEDRVALEAELIKAAQEDDVAREEIKRSPRHVDLE